jgi:uncharacterized RDD family membrane protein YckC
MWGFLETGLLANWGYTPGKFLWGIKVKLKDEDEISYLKALTDLPQLVVPLSKL